MIASRDARRIAFAALAAASVALAACGQQKAPKVDAATERAEAQKRAAEGPFGTQVKSLETAKGLEADLNKKAQDSVDKMEKDAK